MAPTKKQLNLAPNTPASASAPKLYNPVQVFCRIRPLPSKKSHVSCISVKDESTIALVPPEQWVQMHKSGAPRVMEYIFKRVLAPSAKQNDVFRVVAQPLLENLLRGHNSLLYTYGVTDSGKTFTMTGDIGNRGLMPLCFESLFGTIADCQANKFLFKPDHLNGFEILSEAEAEREREAESKRQAAATYRGQERPLFESSTDSAALHPCELTQLQGLDEDNLFAVFVTYIEVYNNSVYDLLENTPINKTWQSKIIRTDALGNMYVHGISEIEVKTADDALAVFENGQRRKMMASTLLNTESSRSHSVLNIRLVQAPTDCQGKHVVRDKATITISQLSLVDLAGSERSSRTNNKGMRLRETGNINNSLMTLRTCLEYLRHNQQATSGAPPKMIPYRDAKITHLFRRYFDGEGQVSMIVCVNPHADDYDENAHVLKFAEMTQAVQTLSAAPVKPIIEFTPGRRRANMLCNNALNKGQEAGESDPSGDSTGTQPKLDHEEVPDIDLLLTSEALKSGDFQRLRSVLEQRIARKRLKIADLDVRYDDFRSRIMLIEMEKKSLKDAYEKEIVKGQDREKKLLEQSRTICDLENELLKVRRIIANHQKETFMEKENELGPSQRSALKNRNAIHKPTYH